MEWSSVLQEVAKDSPYAIILIIFLGVFSKLYTKNIATMKDLFEQSIKLIKESQKEAVEQLRENMKVFNGISSPKSKSKNKDKS